MMKTTLLAVTIVVAIVSTLALAGFLTAQTTSSAALTGKVTSQAEGPMEGVLVGAKKAGSTISIWVVTNGQGQYSFPRERLQPGTYTMSIRAVGYELPKTSVEVSSQSAQLDLKLDKVTRPTKLATQMSNGELLTSVPGTQEQKLQL